MVYSLTWLPDVLKEADLKVAEHPGWRSRGHGDVAHIRGVICHHTAGAPASRGVMPSLSTLVTGRAASTNAKALPGPLSQLGLARDGTWIVIAAGRANHAGKGQWKGIATGNSSFIGIEAEHTGKASDCPWPDVQMDAYRRGVAAILQKIGAPVEMCCGHKEYAPGRKPDPCFDMDEFRNDVAVLMRGEGDTRPLIPAIDAMQRPTLRRGATGDLVKKLQRMLGVDDDGIFGSGTEAGARAFQRANGLVPDGIIGPKSWAKLDEVQ